jgi:hypothetical protein
MGKVIWTSEEIQYLHANYADNFTEDVAKALKKSVKSVYAKAYSLDIRKSKSHHKKVMAKTSIRIREGAKIHRYAKGHEPANKGKKMPAEIYAKVAPTMFGKGHKPHNFRPVGSERLTKDGYLERKVADPKTWRAVHILVWEAAHGPVPAKHKVIFKDNNKLNNELNNLECVSYADAMLRNSIIRYPADLRFAMKTLKKLKRQINNGTKQD